jgi:hypothetical protein
MAATATAAMLAAMANLSASWMISRPFSALAEISFKLRFPS